jgi:hypothetical protein
MFRVLLLEALARVVRAVLWLVVLAIAIATFWISRH